MRHRKKRFKLTKNQHQRKSFLRNLASSLILKERITTNEARAKKLRPFLEKSISRAREDNLTNRRFLLKDYSKKVVDKLLKELGPRYKSQPGGYTRLIKTSMRKIDAAKMVIMELVKK